MTFHQIDNSLKNLGKAILWQYDKAHRLLAIIKHMQVLYYCAVESFWKWWTEKVLSIDTCGELGCTIWGIFLGVPRPLVIDEKGRQRAIVPSVYRRFLKGTFYLMKANGSFSDIRSYLEIVFGISGNSSLSKWKGSCSEYGWTINLSELNDEYQPNTAYPEGYVFWYHWEDDKIGGNYKCTRSISAAENKSWNAISDWVHATTEETTGSSNSDTILLKLIDPEGIVRKIGGAPKGSLSVSVSMEFGETTITAQATRNRKCGITLTDNGDMSITYGKSEFYNEMHRDQRLLFEQHMDTICPYPLGIKTNDPQGENWVWGVEGQTNVLYEVGVAYSKDDIFGYGVTYEDNGDITVDEEYGAYNYKVLEDISAEENTSFKAIEGKVKKTIEGGQFVCSRLGGTLPYFSKELILEFLGGKNTYLSPSDYRSIIEVDYRGMRRLFNIVGYASFFVYTTSDTEGILTYEITPLGKTYRTVYVLKFPIDSLEFYVKKFVQTRYNIKVFTKSGITMRSDEISFYRADTILLAVAMRHSGGANLPDMVFPFTDGNEAKELEEIVSSGITQGYITPLLFSEMKQYSDDVMYDKGDIATFSNGQEQIFCQPWDKFTRSYLRNISDVIIPNLHVGLHKGYPFFFEDYSANKVNYWTFPISDENLSSYAPTTETITL